MLFQCFPYSCVLFDSREICAVGHRLCFYCYSSWVRPGLLPPNLGGILVPEPPHQAPCVWCGSAQSLSRTTEICPLRRHWRSMSNVILTETPFVWTFLFISALKLETTTVSHTDTLKGRYWLMVQWGSSDIYSKGKQWGYDQGFWRWNTVWEQSCKWMCLQAVSEHSSHSRLQTSDVSPGQTIACSLLYELSASHFYVILPAVSGSEGPQWSFQ